MRADPHAAMSGPANIEADPESPALAVRLGLVALGIALRGAETAIRRTTRDGTRVYFDSGLFPWTAPIEHAWRDVRAELDVVLAERDRIPAFEELSDEQRPITDDGRWKTFVLRVFGTPVPANCARCPATAALLATIPGLCNAMFSILAPRKRIPEHRGPYNGLLRYHLALKVPQDADRCSIEVDGIRRTWREGRTLVFDDSFAHAVDNDTDDERVVLFADFERPLPWPLRSINRAMLDLLARTPLARKPLERLGVAKPWTPPSSRR